MLHHAHLFSKASASSPIVRRVCAKPITRFGCTIRAYPAHAKELNNPNPESVHFFYKPACAAFQLQNNGVIPIPVRFGSCHHEIEICLLIGETPLPDPEKDGAVFDPAAIRRSIEGIGLGIDWTLRDVQQVLSKQGLPWERAKSFQRSGAITEFLDVAATGEKEKYLGPLDDATGIFPSYEFALIKNGKQVQKGNTDELQFGILSQIWEMHKVSRFQHGDVVMTGTPTGVGPTQVGDDLQLVCEKLQLDVSVKVIAESKL
jgi:2-keto-4-pentenoate hydratase/2-oxohepta-3-ene-1,7-dioic acid hydratase in catechol pathway